MAVQMSTGAPQDFVTLQPQSGTTAENRPEPSSSGPDRSFKDVFNSLREQSTEAAGHSARTKGSGKAGESRSAARQDSAESRDARLRLFLKMTEGLEGVDELAGTEGLEGPVADEISPGLLEELMALQEAAKAASKKGRFDPDAILQDGSPTAGGEAVPEETATGPNKAEPISGAAVADAPGTMPIETPTAGLAVPAETLSQETVAADELGLSLEPQMSTEGEKADPLVDLAGSQALDAEEGLAEDLPQDVAKVSATQNAAVAETLLKEAPKMTTAVAEPVKETVEAVVPQQENNDGDADTEAAEEAASGSLEETMARARNDRARNRGGDEYASGRDDSSRFTADGQTGRRQTAAANNAKASAAAAGDSVADTAIASRTQSSSSAQSFATELSAASAVPQREDAASTGTGRTEAAVRPDMTQMLERQNAFGEGITNVLEFLKTDGTNQARIVVEPPALGRIDVSLQAGSNGVEAAFRVDNENLKQVLQQQLDSLKSSLEAQGIHVSGLTVDIRNKEDQRGRADVSQQGRKNRRITGAEAAEEGLEEGARLVRLDLEKGLLHWLA